MSKQVAKVIAFLCSKGGVGKTTLCTHVAGWLHLHGARVLILDLDTKQGSATAWSASRAPDPDLSVQIQDRPLTQQRFAQVLAACEKPPAYVLLDGPAQLSEPTAAAARIADLIVVPVRADQFAVWALDQTRKLLDAQDLLRAAPAARQYVLTQARRNSRLTAAALEALQQIQPDALVLHESTQYGVASLRGLTITALAKGSRHAAELEQLARVVGGRNGGRHG